MANIKKDKVDDEKDFDDWVESIKVVDKDQVPISPKLVIDEDEGEDGEE